MQFAKLNGVTLHYQVIGATDDKPVLVFSNSLGTDFRIWRDVIMQFVGDYAIVAYDKRGHGLSELGQTPYEMEDHVGDLAALLDHLRVTNAIVCGLSVGGMIAQGLALSRPDLVQALILCDTGHKIGTDELWNSRIAAVEENGIASIADSILERWFSADYRKPENADFTGYANMLIRTPPKGYTGTSSAIQKTDYTEQVSRIAVPTICVVGEEDRATPPQLVQDLARRIPDAKFEMINGAGHLPCIEQPDRLVDVMKAFLAQIPKTGAKHV